jgi:tetratricopeptide (TPR) repeat protein
MHARYAFAILVVLVSAASVHAQPREFERFHEHFRPHERVVVLPMPRRGEEHPASWHRTVEPIGPGQGGDGALCDNPDGDPDMAIAACGRFIVRGQIRGGYSVAIAYAHRGQAYENKADHEHAIRDFSDAIRLKPGEAGYFIMRAGASEKSGKIDAARDDFRLAMNLAPTNQDALNGLRRIETRSVAGSGGPTNPPAAPTPVVPAFVSVANTVGRTAASGGTAAAGAGQVPASVATPPIPKPPTVATAALTVPLPAAALPSATAGSTSNATAGARVALVIGNGKYVNANVLPNPPNDAHAMAGALREIGFDVQEGENLGRADMETQLRDFLHKAANASIVLLFYAGHGMQVDGKNYLVPVDAKLAEASDLPFETIEIDKVLDSLGDPGHTNIILLDACRDNPLARSFARHLPASRSAAVATGLAAYSAVGTGTLIAYATAPGQTALDGQGADSPFTTSLLHNIRTPGLEIRQVLTRVRAEVASQTGNRQIPWDNSSLMGDVVLVK